MTVARYAVVRSFLILGALLVTLGMSAQAPRAATYRAIVDHFAIQPRRALEELLAMPREALANAVHTAARNDSEWTMDDLDRALLMHGEAAVMLSRGGDDAARQLSLGDELATALAQRPGNAWFVHRWYRAVTARIRMPPAIEEHWHDQPWYRGAVAIDRGRELELAAGHWARPEIPVVNAPELHQALVYFERASPGDFPVAALHLGRIQMLLGNESEARRFFGAAAEDTHSRVNRYLAHLFLGSLEERDGILDMAERYYRQALTALPLAQSGRVALAAVLVRSGRDADARAALVAAGPPPYDPWWSYLRGSSDESQFIFAELHSEVSR